MGQSLFERCSALSSVLRETPLVQLTASSINLFAKLESHNSFGSLKARPALWIIRCASERGDIDEGTNLVESSSGNFAAALALYARLLGLRFIPVIDPNISATYEDLLRRNCADVVKVTEPDESGGFLKTRLKKVEELCATLDNCFWTNQYSNLDASESHYRFTAEEICSRFSSLDYVFIGVSTGATIAGISRRLKEKFPRVCIVAVDAEGSVIFGGPPRKRQISGIGSSIRPPLLEHAIIDEVAIIPEIEAVQACRELLWKHGLFVGGSSGSCYAAVKRYLPKIRSSSPPNVLFLCADGGAAYAKTVFNDAWTAKLEQ
ncbi:MAG TPA: 2,3-diaminopropionate biosynthesis protein SbnA [Candidatus Nanopelagicales bacterium]|nr:2,3-diaminopropionate biosynthesis protein SbnA [Candidatus Nanopelagicales bacterium]